HFWLPRSSSQASDPDTQWEFRAMFGTVPLPQSWPVYVSWAEAQAFARWAGKKLPTEPQWHRAAYGTHEVTERAYPWGEEPPDPSRGNFNFQRWDAAPVDAHPGGASAFGVFDLLGNGWEWTGTPFGPLPGFQPFPFYPGYSRDFFVGGHFVMKGGSARTDACMLRRTFRNWFQPHYPYVYATFRCVEDSHHNPSLGADMLTYSRPTRHVSEFADAVRDGLTKPGQKELPSKYLYDEVGSSLFETICVLPEYGLTRADARLLETHAREIVEQLPRPISVAELGSGTGKK